MTSRIMVVIHLPIIRTRDARESKENISSQIILLYIFSNWPNQTMVIVQTNKGSFLNVPFVPEQDSKNWVLILWHLRLFHCNLGQNDYRFRAKKNSSLLSAAAWNIVDTTLFIDLDRKIHQRNVSCVMGMRCEHSDEYNMKKVKVI